MAPLTCHMLLLSISVSYHQTTFACHVVPPPSGEQSAESIRALEAGEVRQGLLVLCWLHSSTLCCFCTSYSYSHLSFQYAAFNSCLFAILKFVSHVSVIFTFVFSNNASKALCSLWRCCNFVLCYKLHYQLDTVSCWHIILLLALNEKLTKLETESGWVCFVASTPPPLSSLIFYLFVNLSPLFYPLRPLSSLISTPHSPQEAMAPAQCPLCPLSVYPLSL